LWITPAFADQPTPWDAPADSPVAKARHAPSQREFAVSLQVQQDSVGPEVPEPWSDKEPDPAAELELAMRVFNTWLRHPSSAFRSAQGLYDDGMVTVLKRDGTVVRLQGEAAKRLLMGWFKMDGATYHFATPEVRIEGRYGMVTRKFSIREGNGSPECFVQHAQAFRTMRGWRFLAITLAFMPTLHRCVIENEQMEADP
jgi:hypothetical protein